MSEQLLEKILTIINDSSDLNKDNVINKIAERLRIEDPNTYKEWQVSEFSIDYKFNGQLTLLHMAAKNGYIEVVKALIDKGAKVDEKDKDKCTPLHYASKRGCTETVKILIKNGADVNEKDNNGWVPLHYAAKYDHTDILKILIDKEVNVDKKTNNGLTPLHYAAKYGRTDILKTLIDKGANVDEKDDNGWTPLHYAAKYYYTKIEKDNEDLTTDAKYRYTEIMKTLIDKGAKVNLQDNNGCTPLYLAVPEYDMIALLLRSGADPLLRNSDIENLKHLVKYIKDNDVESSKEEKAQQKEKQVDDEYELLKYSLLSGHDNSLTHVIEEDAFNNLMSEWFADESGLTESQRKLNKELLSILKDLPSCDVTRLENFLQDNKGNDDLKFILNLQKGKSELTVLHVISSMANLMVEGDTGLVVGKLMDLLLTAGADPNIPPTVEGKHLCIMLLILVVIR